MCLLLAVEASTQPCDELDVVVLSIMYRYVCIAVILPFEILNAWD
jgi:hypothetical protein